MQRSWMAAGLLNVLAGAAVAGLLIGCSPQPAGSGSNNEGAGSGTDNTPSSETAVTVKPDKVWMGRVQLPMAMEPPDASGAYIGGHKVIRDREAFLSFIESIPKTQILPTNPAPPSNNPLLKKPEVDFANKMVLVATRSENMHVEVRFGEISRKGNTLTVEVIYPPVGDTAMEQSQLGIGTFVAVLVDRAEKVEFRETRQE